jgi:hypothetical protein
VRRGDARAAGGRDSERSLEFHIIHARAGKMSAAAAATATAAATAATASEIQFIRGGQSRAQASQLINQLMGKAQASECRHSSSVPVTLAMGSGGRRGGGGAAPAPAYDSPSKFPRRPVNRLPRVVALPGSGGPTAAPAPPSPSPQPRSHAPKPRPTPRRPRSERRTDAKEAGRNSYPAVSYSAVGPTSIRPDAFDREVH